MLALLLFLPAAQAFLFGGGGAGCRCAAPPACPPPPVCPPPVCPAQPTCSGPVGPPASYAVAAPYPRPPAVYGPPASAYASSGRGKALRTAHGKKIGVLKAFSGLDKDNEYLEETKGMKRIRRDTEAVFDPKCNSEALKEIILENINPSTATAKRQIQDVATEKLGGRIDVICSTGTFSYIVNTELYCETEKDGTTCFAFRQSP